MTSQLTIGFLPLVDACLPILAHEHGFAEEEGLALAFMRDVSWATVLDRLLYQHTDAAHLIAPLAIATTLGRGRPAQPLSAPFVLGLNGNAITFGLELAAQLGLGQNLADPVSLGETLRAVVKQRREAGRPVRFGVVHRYSSHNYKLRYWLAASGIVPDRDVEICTVAPPFISDALAGGEIDGACVGEPWNSVCVERGVGVIGLATAQIWRRGVEKVLALRSETLEARRPDAEALIRAMRKAGEHFVREENWEANAAILSRPEYLNQRPELIMRAISDRLVLKTGDAPVYYSDFMFQHREAANFPWISQAQWLYSQMVRWDGLDFSASDAQIAGNVFRPDIYRSALKGRGDSLPGASSKVEGSVLRPTAVGAQSGSIILGDNTFFDGPSFDPDHIEAYLASLP